MNDDERRVLIESEIDLMTTDLKRIIRARRDSAHLIEHHDPTLVTQKQVLALAANHSCFEQHIMLAVAIELLVASNVDASQKDSR